MKNIFDDREEYDDLTFESVTIDNETIASKEFDSCVFRKCAFLETRFRGCRFLNCTFQDCEMNLIHVEDCSFTEARFEDSKVIGVDWTQASWAKKGLLNSIHFYRCVVNHSTFAGLLLKRMTMTECTARDIDFSEADLTQANCTGTDFAQSRFWQTNLTNADFRGAQNYAIAAQLNTLKRTRFSLPEAMSLLYSLDIILEE